MTTPASTAAFGAAGAQSQRAFGGNPTTQEQNLYNTNPASVVMAPIFGILQSRGGQQSPGAAAASPQVPRTNPTNTGNKTLLGQ